ncbi:polyamine aminopropyltransferase [Gordonia sp. HNM0687]|uniref:Polyamine aminopropyltransferase n=1 Tax=Gordonia mangrovi TaxID=2665643 RepID=A0A6L7GWD7_9ACTN|nr:polyamine aminopropyltransferase [Gordonia mangrovi]MXP23893.1 polyamine aminopropyltransferase [Gordonia mangrovi]UVF76445.1 polyamine aminopropyltransferase [Gordonia mangrovi]
MTTTDDSTLTDPAAGDDPGHRPGRWSRAALLTVVFVCAACGLVYELALVSLGSFLIGNTATQASIVLAVMVFAMGVGSLAAKPLQSRPIVTFAAIELALALLGGLSVMGLYAAFAYLSLYTPALVVVAFVLGLLIGAEIPLLMVLLQRIRRQDAGSAVADMFAVDYIGALVGGLCFPFLLLPLFGQLEGALVVGLVNAAAGSFLVFVVFRRDLSRPARAVLGIAAVSVIAALVAGMVWADRFEVTARQAMFRDPIVAAERTPYQDIVITERRTPLGPDTRLYLNGDLQFSSIDEYRYHESLVHPAMAGPHDRVLILGGGDGLGLREVLRYPGTSATLVELDPEMIRLGREDERLTRLNQGSLDDSRSTVVTADAFSWLRQNRGAFDVIIVDMPDPDDSATAKLYSTEFYALAARHLADGGRMVVQAGSPYFAPKSFWCIESTLRDAGLASRPYHADVPSFGDWGFFLTGRGGPPTLRLDAPGPMRFLSDDELAAAAVFPADRPRLDLPPSTLMDPRILRYAQGEWSVY